MTKKPTPEEMIEVADHITNDGNFLDQDKCDQVAAWLREMAAAVEADRARRVVNQSLTTAESAQKPSDKELLKLLQECGALTTVAGVRAIRAALTRYGAQPAASETPVVWRSWKDGIGYGFWDTKAEAELNSVDDFEPEALGVIAAPVAQEPVGWQFFDSSRWHYGNDDIKDHRANTESAGYPVRDVFAVPVAAQPSMPDSVTRVLNKLWEAIQGMEHMPRWQDVARARADLGLAPAPKEGQS